MAVLRGFGPSAAAVVEIMGWDEAFETPACTPLPRVAAGAEQIRIAGELGLRAPAVASVGCRAGRAQRVPARRAHSFHATLCVQRHASELLVPRCPGRSSGQCCGLASGGDRS